MQKLKQYQEEQKWKEAKDEIRKDKEDDKRAKQRIREQIARDRYSRHVFLLLFETVLKSFFISKQIINIELFYKQHSSVAHWTGKITISNVFYSSISSSIREERSARYKKEKEEHEKAKEEARKNKLLAEQQAAVERESRKR